MGGCRPGPGRGDQDAYDVNVHGNASSSSAATATAHLRADMGYAYGDVLDCDACHDPHGSANPWALKTDIASANGVTHLTGAALVKMPLGAPAATPPTGYDMRFWCTTCHVWDPAEHEARTGAPTTVFPTDCTPCHRHVDSQGHWGHGL